MREIDISVKVDSKLTVTVSGEAGVQTVIADVPTDQDYRMSEIVSSNGCSIELVYIADLSPCVAIGLGAEAGSAVAITCNFDRNARVVVARACEGGYEDNVSIDTSINAGERNVLSLTFE